MRYLVEFADNKIGRGNRAESQTIEAADADQLAEKVHRYARRFLASSEVEVKVNLAAEMGSVTVGGFRPVGTFTVTELAEATG